MVLELALVAGVSTMRGLKVDIIIAKQLVFVLLGNIRFVLVEFILAIVLNVMLVMDVHLTSLDAT
jgi:hypothetical protein